MVDGCDAFHLVVSDDNCADIASSAGISVSEFETWNPTVGSGCSGLWLGYYVCVGIVGGNITSTTATTTTASTSTSTGNGVTIPTPYETGMVDDCDAFHLVVSGDDCANIASDADITVDELYTWNPTVGTSCSGLWLGYYVCVGIL